MNAIAVFTDAWRNRHNLGDKKQSSQLAAFLPAALEIQEAPPNPLSRWLAWSLLALVLIGICWASFGEVNIVASADGKIIPSSRVKQIQPLEKGVVKSILVREGEAVSKGQALVELDTTLTNADKNSLKNELHSSTLNLALNQALLSQIEQSFASKEQSIVKREDLTLNLPTSTSPTETQLYKRMLWQRWQEFWSQTQSLESTLRKTQAEHAATKEIISKLEQTLPIATKRANNLSDLYKKDFVSETDYLQSEQERIQQQQDLAAERQRYKQLVAAESEVREQINVHVAQASSSLLTQIADHQRQISTLQEELTKATDLNDKQILYSPVAGRVQELTVNTIGGVVTEAQQLMLIIPDEERLEVEVFLENKDIGFVHKDMAAEIKIHTFPFTKYGIIEADVSNVSNDAIVDERQGLIYGMQLQMATNTIWVDGKEVRLMPGMAVTAEVKTGKRRIIEFFLTPLLRAKKESIRER